MTPSVVGSTFKTQRKPGISSESGLSKKRKPGMVVGPRRKNLGWLYRMVWNKSCEFKVCNCRHNAGDTSKFKQEKALLGDAETLPIVCS